jgi:chromosome segregation ATPase
MYTASIYSAILHVAEHVCGHQPSPPAFTSATDTWAAMENVISMSTPGVSLMGRNLKNMTMEEHQLALLSALICFSVSDSSIDRKTHVGMILSLPRDMQQRLRKIIEAPMGSSERTVSSITESNVSRRSREEETPTGFTPAKKKQNAAADDALFSPAIGMDRMVQDLKEQNHQLQKQLANSTSREAELAIRMQDLEQKVRRDMMRIESNHLRKADEAHEAHTKELTELRDELFALQTVRAKEEVAQRELSTIKDEMDLMEHTKEKLTETEEKLRKCKERLEQLADVKESLKREEEAHSASVEECLRLDNELKSLQPLRRQLDEYKARTIDAEFKLVECQDALQQMSAMSANLNSTHSELVKGARLQQEEADGLRMKLSKDDDDEDIDEGLGEGISELNPHVKEELLRLRYENKELHEFRAKREADGVTRLEEQLDDVQRLCDRFKEQYLSTKKELEVTVVDLKETKEHEEQLKRDVAEWTGKWESMDAWATELQGQLDTTRQELTETIQLLEESKEREEGLTTNVEGLTKEKEELIVESEERLAELTSTQQEATDTMELLVQSQDREKELHTDLEDVEEKLQAEQQRCGGFENELNLAVEELDTTKHDLNETIDREKKVRSNLVELSEEKDALDQELEAEKEAREADRIEAVMKVAEAREGLEAESKQALEDLEANMNMLLEGERESSKKKLQQGNDDYQQLFEQNASDYNDLQTKMTSSLEETIRDYDVRITRLKEDYTSQMEAVKVEADASRDKLVSRGKNMLKDTKDKAEEIIRELEDELEDTKESLSTFRKDKDEFEHKIRAKVTSYKHKLQFSSSRINELSEENDQLMDTVHTVEKEKAKVLEENERYRRQLGGRYGADGKNQNQMDMLQKEFNAILEENRNLKRKLASAGSTGMLGAISEGEPEYGDTSSGKPYARGGVSGSTLSALREEYEEQIQSLNDEKRELVMRNSAAITDVQKAEQRAWELEKNMERLKEDLTSSHLALQRAELNMDDDQTETGAVIDQSFVSREESFHSAKETEEERRQYMDTILSNQGPSEDALDHETQSPLLVDLDIFPMQPETPTNVLSPSNHQIESAKKKVSFGGATSKPLSRSSSESSEGPSLMELTMQNGGSQDGQPECKQS